MTQIITNRVIIGGSPSTGSSLLRRILNRHSSIYSGEETSLFTKADLYADWNKNKSKLFKKKIWGLRSAGWHLLTGVNLEDPDLGIDRNQLNKWVQESEDFKTFTDQYFVKSLEHNRASIWIEKTPSNVFLFEEFRKEFGGNTIHIVRHPLDTIASMMSRGENIYEAVTKYFMFVNAGLRSVVNKKHHLIKYETLISDPEKTVHAICDFLELNFEVEMLKEGSQKDSRTVSKMKGWNYDETEEIGRGSVGRFKRLSVDQRKMVLYAIQKLELKDEFKTTYQFRSSNYKELFTLLDYKIGVVEDNTKAYPIMKEMLRDQWTRSIRMYPHHLFNYPFKLV